MYTLFDKEIRYFTENVNLGAYLSIAEYDGNTRKTKFYNKNNDLAFTYVVNEKENTRYLEIEIDPEGDEIKEPTPVRTIQVDNWRQFQQIVDVLQGTNYAERISNGSDN